MTDEEFNRYCAEVMMYIYADWWNPATDLNQMAEVFDKLWLTAFGSNSAADEMIYMEKSLRRIGIAGAMREFIEGTKE